MKILSTFEALTTKTSSGAGAGFPVANIADLDPFVRWVADAYTGDVWVKVDFGSAKVLTGLFLNQCNFPHCHVQGHASDSWASPSFDLGVDLVLDDAANRKGWFDLVAFNYRWLRILIPGSQTLDKSETVPAIGNLLVGAAVTLPLVSDFEARMVQRVRAFEADGGGYRESKQGRARHLISIGIGDSLANIRAMPKAWADAVIYADLGDAGDSWLVFPPNDWSRPIRSIIDAELRFQLRERP
jgi:hypothetical protein